MINISKITTLSNWKLIIYKTKQTFHYFGNNKLQHKAALYFPDVSFWNFIIKRDIVNCIKNHS